MLYFWWVFDYTQNLPQMYYRYLKTDVVKTKVKTSTWGKGQCQDYALYILSSG